MEKKTTIQEQTKEKTVLYIPKQVLKRVEEEVPTLPAPVITRDWNEKRGEWKERESFAATAKKANLNPDGFTEVLKKTEKKRITKLEELKQMYVAPERERRLSIRLNRRKGGR